MNLRRRPRSSGALLAGVMAMGALAACSSGPRREGTPPAATAAGGQASPKRMGAGGAPDAAALPARKRARTPPPVARPEDVGPPVEMVTIHVLVEPPQRAHVIWGAKDFGLGPVDIKRPRGSGPLDLLLRAPGYMTLHTRAFTDRDNTLSVHLVPEAEASRFPGYQAPAPTVAAHATPPAAVHQKTARATRSAKPSPASVP